MNFDNQEKNNREEQGKNPETAPVEENKIEEVSSVPAEPEKKDEAPLELKWYVIQTYSGQEDRVKRAIEQNIDRLGLRHKISKVLVPEEEVVELHGKKRVEKKKNMFAGYVFLEMALDDESWYAIRQTPGVARFIGTKTKPTPVSDREMQRVLKQIGVKSEKLEIAFERGEIVRVISGPFRGYTGTIDEINVDREKLKVLINIFGRDTPVEVNFEHAEKVV
ncbi:transcription termination/antitermination factor NusG [Candidatus Saganbacteria bacterium]|nr:transcription termination/antitermination factor NusG [Candidatus Saganbacteria bacterium]